METCEPESTEEAQGAIEVNMEYLLQLKELDIPEEEAKKALIVTGNISAEEAAIFYFENLERMNEEVEDEENYHKMVFVVNMELPMGVGKLFFSQIAAQVAHAAVGLYQILIKESKTREMAYKWDNYGAKKVVLQGSSTAHLLELQALALSMNLPNYLVQDAGRTQIAAGSYTVLSIMGEEESVNKVTGKLKLLN
ncbi:probable peptidyl-tRNA hydrolase 2 isoform X1 [Xenopus laevis]|uniref:peptidyl-tRNA hydrolase n=1 Tax=Xenopus laevis TaxID=8355 RepID=A0A8J0V7F9_XENLA|nr:probable peptidyl-tRNA hydrolase 2 isoform X1 [Xenopus laevis]XP_018116939.1 probable peptidyl-tRNA hydrolase 2 isoform X1 [Xenopus laevis]XP_018116941.1 probable peptidyl-tRNA hydrolase 2 isoform X1 [Xenopus laevis]